MQTRCFQWNSLCYQNKALHVGVEVLKPLVFLFSWAVCSDKGDIGQKHEA